MISKDCKYSYYTTSAEVAPYMQDEILSWEKIKELLEYKKIESITGFSDYIIIRTKDKKLFPLYYACSYYPAMIKNLFGISTGLDNIINTYVNNECKTAEEAETYFMAKILGAR